MPKDHKIADQRTVEPPFTVQQLADYLGMSRQALDHMRHRGQGPKYIRISGRCIRYRREDVEAWLADRVHQGVSEYRVVDREAEEMLS